MRLLMVCVAACLVACQSASSRIQVALPLEFIGAYQSALLASPARVTLDVACAKGTTSTHEATLTASATEVVFPDVKPCGAAALTLKVHVTPPNDALDDAEQTAPVLAFAGTAQATLVPGDVAVAFRGPLLGELSLRSTAPAQCTVNKLDDAEPLAATALDVAPVRLSLAVGHYDIACTAEGYLDSLLQATVTAGGRALYVITLEAETRPPVLSDLSVSAIHATGAVATWAVSSSSGVAISRVELARDEAFTQPTTFEGLTQPTLTLTGLVPSSTYWLRVQATHQGGASPYLTTTFTTTDGSEDAALAELRFNDVVVASFSPEQLAYEVAVPFGANEYSVSATARGAGATIAIGEADPVGDAATATLPYEVPHALSIVVTSGDGTAARTYTLYVDRAPPVVQNITVTQAVDAEPAQFDPLDGSIIFYLPIQATEATFVLSCAPTCDGIRVDDGAQILPVADGTITLPLQLVSSFTFLTPVLGSDMDVTNDVAVVRGGVLDLTPSVGALSPAFDPEVTNYEIVTSASAIGLVPTSMVATDEVDDAPLTLGANTFVIASTSPNGVVLASYEVEVVRTQLVDIDFLGAVEVAPAFDVAFTGPYTLYMSVGLEQLGAQLQCEPSCDSASASFNGQSVPFESQLFAVTPNLGSNDFQITVNDSGRTEPVTYMFTARRGALINLVPANGTLQPQFDPQVTSYDFEAPTANITFSPTLFGAAYTNSLTNMALAVGENTLAINVYSPGGAAIDTYTIHAIRKVVFMYDYNPVADLLQVGPMALSLSNGGYRSSVASSFSPQGPRIVEIKQRAGTRHVYTLHDDPVGVDGIGVHTVVNTAGLLAQRPLTASPVDDSDYVFPLGEDVDPTNIVFSPAAEVLYTYGADGYVYRVTLTGTFVEGSDVGSAGLPDTAEPLNPEPLAVGAYKLLISHDGRWLFAIQLGAGAVELAPFELDPDDGTLVATPGASATIDGPVAATLTRDGRFLVVANATSVRTYEIDTSTGALTLAGSFTVNDTYLLRANPTRDVVYAILNTGGLGRIRSLSYDPSTGALGFIAAFDHGTLGPYVNVDIDPTGRFYLLHVPVSGGFTGCNLWGYPVAANGSIGVANGSGISCDVTLTGYYVFE